MADSIKNVALCSPTGKFGPYIVSALQSEGFTITAIIRKSSTAPRPSGVKVITVSDDYPEDEMVSAFQDQDAAVLSLAWEAFKYHSSMVKASIKAGVKRTIASNYGGNPWDEASDIFPINPAYRERIKELKSLEQPGWSWTAFSTGAFFDLCITVDFFGVDRKTHTAKLLDQGTKTFSTTTRETAALATARALKHPEETANKNLFVSSFEITQHDVLSAYKKAINHNEWDVSYISTDEQVKMAQEALARGERMAGMGKLAWTTTVGEGFSNDYTTVEGGTANEMLGLPREDIDEVVKKSLELPSPFH